jgi:hypothetical protein
VKKKRRATEPVFSSTWVESSPKRVHRAPRVKYDTTPDTYIRDSGSRWEEAKVYSNRAFVMDAPGSGPLVFRDRRHSDLKRPKALKVHNEPGAPRRADVKPSFKKSGGINNPSPEWRRAAILHNLTER